MSARERDSGKIAKRKQRSGILVGRRDFFKLIGLGTLGFGFGVSIFDSIFQYAEGADKTERREKHMLLTVGTVDFMGFRAKGNHSEQEFYITTYSDKVPDLQYEAHSLRIEGLVEKPYTLTMKELEAMKDRTEFVTLQCIGNPVGGDSIGNALWDGVTLKKILDRAQPKTGIVKAAFFAGDGYSDSIPYALAQSDGRFLGVQDEW